MLSLYTCVSASSMISFCNATDPRSLRDYQLGFLTLAPSKEERAQLLFSVTSLAAVLNGSKDLDDS